MDKGIISGIICQIAALLGGLIRIENILEGIIIAFLGGIFGYLGSKLIKYVERKINKRANHRKPH